MSIALGFAASLCEELSKDICQISEGASDLCVFFVGDVAAAHGTEVGRFELTVDKSAPEFAKPGGEVDEGELRGVGNQREHALTEEEIVDDDTIESTHYFLPVPYLDTGGEAFMMEIGVGLDHFGTEPGALILIAVLGSGAVLDDGFEVGVEADSVLVLLHELTHGMTDVYLVGEDDKTVEGTVPEGLWLLLIGVPREIAIEVAQYEAVDTEVATHCY